MKNKLFLVLLLNIFLFNCSSDSDNPADENPDGNDGVLISSITEVDPEDGFTYTINFTYDGNKLTRISDNDDYSTTLIYDNDQLVRLENYDDGNLEEYATYEYNSDGTVASYTVYYVSLGDIDGSALKYVIVYNGDGTITEEVYRGDFESQTQFSYNITKTVSNGNIVSEVDEDLQDDFFYQFDTRNSIYKNISAIEALELSSNAFESGFIFYGSNNNITKITREDPFELSEETFEYSYNSNDYPTNATYKYFSDGELEYESTLTFTYQ